MPTLIRLHVEAPRGRPFERRFEGRVVVVGRAPSSDLILTDRFLSRSHARFYLQGETVMVEDLDELVRYAERIALLNEAIETDLERFAAGEPFADDRTIVLARRTD